MLCLDLLAPLWGVYCTNWFAGVHTSSYTFSFLVYHLARSPRVQELLRQEATILLHQESVGSMTRDLLARAHYAKACLREDVGVNPKQAIRY